MGQTASSEKNALLKFTEVKDRTIVGQHSPGHLCGAALAWENMLAATQIPDPILFGLAAVVWLKETPCSNYRVLESRLRASGVDTNVVAISIPKDMDASEFRHTDTTRAAEPPRYMCIFFCGPEDYRKGEYANWKTTAEESDSRLESAVVQKQFYDESLREKLDGIHGVVLRNTHLVTVRRKLAESSYDEIVKAHSEEVGQQPEDRLVGMTHDGAVIQKLFRVEGALVPIPGFDLAEIRQFGNTDGGGPCMRRIIVQIVP